MLEELFTQALKGDPQAETRLFRELFVRFLRFAGHRLGRDEAQDAAQRACMTIHEKFRTEAISVSFTSWAYGVFRNTLLRAGEKAGRERERLGPLEALEALAAPREPHPLLPGWILDCFRGIVRRHLRYARILNLRHLGYETSEVCRMVGVSSEQYYVYLNRGRALLKVCLSQKGLVL